MILHLKLLIMQLDEHFLSTSCGSEVAMSQAKSCWRFLIRVKWSYASKYPITLRTFLPRWSLISCHNNFTHELEAAYYRVLLLLEGYIKSYNMKHDVSKTDGRCGNETWKILLLCPTYFWVIRALQRAYVGLKKLSRHKYPYLFLTCIECKRHGSRLQSWSCIMVFLKEMKNLILMYFWNPCFKKTHITCSLQELQLELCCHFQSRLRNAGVIWFFFLFSIFYWLNLCFQICVASANLQWNVNENQIKNWTSPVIGRSHLLILQLKT